jgi:pimeloyl-ACP methyl ester carboxylesterase
MNQKINGLNVILDGNSKNQPIIFLHGFPYDNKMWDFQVNHFKKDFYCIRYDIRGLGKSGPGNGQFTMESFVDDLFSIIQELSVKNPIICALSMGGYITLRAIERNQSKFKAVILCDTRTESDSDEGKLKRSAGIKKVNEEGSAAFAKGFVPNCFAEATIKNNSKLYKSILNRAKKSDPVGVKGSLLAMLSRTDTTNSIKKIRIHALIIVGEQDTLTPVEAMKKMAKNIRNSDFHIIPGAGHMTPLERPDLVNKKIEEFLKKLK